jgi:hypothetical protein
MPEESGKPHDLTVEGAILLKHALGKSITWGSDLKGNSITGKVFVKNFEPDIPSVFGLPGDYEITLDAKIVKDGVIEGSAGVAAFS